MTTEIYYFLGGLVLGTVLGLLVLVIYRLRARAGLERLESQLKHQEHLKEEREQALSLATERLAGVFSQLANDQFRAHSETFLKLARENLGAHQEKAKGELAAREQAIESLVKPIKEALIKTEEQLVQLDKHGRETHGSIKAQLEAMALSQQTLSSQTRNLVSALRRPEVRGQWGEITLRRLVELAGMVEHCDFVTQTHQATETGAIRPDMVINLPESRQLVVDVKTPLDAYLEATEADTEEQRDLALDRHGSIVAGRVRELAGKSYWSQFEKSPEFVILFIPGDQFLSAALARRPKLLDDALAQNIILATPTSLVALLKAVAYGWQQVSLAENAAEIRNLAVQLYERLSTFSGHLGALGKALKDAVKTYNQGIGSLERMVLPSARRFTELGVKPRKPMPPLEQVEGQLRTPDVQPSIAADTPPDDDTDSEQSDDSQQQAS